MPGSKFSMLPKCQAQNVRLNLPKVEPDISHLTNVRLKFLQMSGSQISTWRGQHTTKLKCQAHNSRCCPNVRLKMSGSTSRKLSLTFRTWQMSGSKFSKCQAQKSRPGGNKTRLNWNVRLNILECGQMSGSKCQGQLPESRAWHFAPDKCQAKNSRNVNCKNLDPKEQNTTKTKCKLQKSRISRHVRLKCPGRSAYTSALTFRTWQASSSKFSTRQAQKCPPQGTEHD